MNEQIEKLAVQAFSFASAADDSDESDANWWNAYNEKFAELIAREYIKNCRDMFIVGSVSWNLLNEKLELFGVE